MGSIFSSPELASSLLLGTLIACSDGGAPDAGPAPNTPDSEPRPTAAHCEQIDDVHVTGAVDLHHLGVAVAPVNDDLVAVVGSDWAGHEYERALELVDVREPAAPTVVGGHYAPGRASAIAVRDDYAYVADPLAGLAVFDITEPNSPIQVGFVEQPDAFDVKIDGAFAYVSFTAAFEESDPSGFHIFDLGEPATPALMGSFNTTGAVRGLGVRGGYALVANRSLIRVVDVRDATTPIEVGIYDSGDLAFHIELDREYAYVGNFASGITVIDVSSPDKPRHVTTIPTDIVNYTVTIAGRFAYIPDDMQGLKVVDVDDPASWIGVGIYRPPNWARDVAIIGNRGFVVEFLESHSGRLVSVKFCELT